MTPDRRLLMVEDIPVAYKALKMEFENAGWHITRREDSESALQVFDQTQKTNRPFSAAAIDLGLPPDIDNPLRWGIPLVQTLRERNSNLPILAYTGIPPTAFEYDILLAKLLPLRVSFVYWREMRNVTLADLLELVWQDFVIISPEPADFLSRAIPHKPDPLDDDLWQTLALLEQSLSYRQIAQALPDIGPEGVKARVQRIRNRLVEVGELESYQREQEDLVIWYRRHHVRYCRP